MVNGLETKKCELSYRIAEAIFVDQPHLILQFYVLCTILSPQPKQRSGKQGRNVK